MKQNIHLINADVIAGLKSIEKNSIDTIITSPPYWGLRNYGVDGQIGMESTLEEYHERLLDVTTECMRVLKPTGVMFWNHGDSYPSGGGKATESSFNRDSGVDTGSQPDNRPSAKLRSQKGKCMVMQNERLIIRMIDEQGWLLRNRIIWEKPNGMPSSVTDRFSNKYEPVYMLVKSKKYWFDLDAVRAPHKTDAANKLRNKSEEAYNQSYTGGHFSPGARPEGHPSGKNPGDVWTIPTQPHKDAHFAIFPDDLVKPMIKAGCPMKICPVCGFIRERIIERIGDSSADYMKNKDKSMFASEQGQKQNMRAPKEYYNRTIKTIGWTSCSCGAGWDPGVVLDPFCGSGTTMIQAKKLGRSATGIELSSEYCKIIKRNLLFHQQTLGNIKNIFTKL